MPQVNQAPEKHLTIKPAPPLPDGTPDYSFPEPLIATITKNSFGDQIVTIRQYQDLGPLPHLSEGHPFFGKHFFGYRDLATHLSHEGSHYSDSEIKELGLKAERDSFYSIKADLAESVGAL